jgi:lantibiotic leader peptide-processing serine protease
MKKTWLSVLLTTSLILTTVIIPASATTQSKNYVIAFKQQVPDNYAAVIKNAGGKVLRVMPEIGGMEVQSDNANFLSNLKTVREIQAANRELTLKLDDAKIDPQNADSQPVTDIPQMGETDSYWNYQWDMKRITNDGASYKIETGGTENADGTVTHRAVVGVIDSGIDANHPDLKANFLGGQNFVPAGGDNNDPNETGDINDVVDRVGHGTHVSGSIAANGKLKGVGPDLGIRAYRIFPASGSAPTSWIAPAIIQAAKDKVDVINMSIGGFDGIARYSYQGDKNAYSDIADFLLYRRAVQYAINHNVTIVVAAGNESLNLNNPVEVTKYMNDNYGDLGLTFKGASKAVPAQIPGVITVSSSIKWSQDKIAFYSNYGSSTIDVAGPGGDNGPIYDETHDINQRDFHYRSLSTYPTKMDPYFTSNLKGYALMHGTSMAAPKVAGIAGVIKAHYQNLSPAQVTALINHTASDFGKPGTDQLFGAGEANIYNALTGTKK